LLKNKNQFYHILQFKKQNKINIKINLIAKQILTKINKKNKIIL